MREHILQFNKQFAYEPKIVNREKLKVASRFIFAGMGGSGLVGSMVKRLKPELDLVVHQSYGLPMGISDLKQRLFITNSYSGNTEETIDSFLAALKWGIPALAMGTGGKLIETTKKKNLPYIQIPDTGIQPRMSTGMVLRGLLKIVGDKKLLKESEKLVTTLKPADYEADGKALAEKLKNKVPVIYSSVNNVSVAYNWKIKLNETGKIPAFYNVLPELNHNEMTGFSSSGGSASGGDTSARHLSEKFCFIFLKDKNDYPRIIKRMEVLKELYEKRGLPVHVVDLTGKNALEQIFSSLVLADWTAFYTAKEYGLDPEQVPMVEEFKGLIR